MNLTDELAALINSLADEMIADTREYLDLPDAPASNTEIAEILSADAIEHACFIELCDDIELMHFALELALSIKLSIAPSLISSQY